MRQFVGIGIVRCERAKKVPVLWPAKKLLPPLGLTGTPSVLPAYVKQLLSMVLATPGMNQLSWPLIGVPAALAVRFSKLAENWAVSEVAKRSAEKATEDLGMETSERALGRKQNEDLPKGPRPALQPYQGQPARGGQQPGSTPRVPTGWGI